VRGQIKFVEGSRACRVYEIFYATGQSDIIDSLMQAGGA